MSPDPVDTQFWINVGIGLATAIGGWLAKTLWDAVENLKKDLHQLEVDLPSNYIQKDQFAESVKEIKDMLSKIFDKLEAKVDKNDLPR